MSVAKMTTTGTAALLSRIQTTQGLEDIFQWVREGDTIQTRVWLDDTEHDMNIGDDHGFSLLHWACKEGQMNIVDMLLSRGARVNQTNMGDDTPLHLAASHGHREIVLKLLRNKADVNFVNEHGNTALHYACFFGYEQMAEDLIQHGAQVSLCNKYGDTPLDKCRRERFRQQLDEYAQQLGLDMRKIAYKDQSSMGTRMRTKTLDRSLSRQSAISGIDLHNLQLTLKLASAPSGETWRGRYQGRDVVTKVLRVREVTPRIPRDFNDEYPKLRIFSHPNVLGVLGAFAQPPNLYIVSEYMANGTLFDILHRNSRIVVDHHQAVRFALDIARGMAFLHSLSPIIRRFYLNSRHVMVDEDMTARLSMADSKFSFQDKGKLYYPAWTAPEALQRRPEDSNTKSAAMWSFGVVLWELQTRQVPFADLLPMQIGMRVALEGLRLSAPPGASPQVNKLMEICMNENPGKRPSFDMIIPILEKMQR
ncbi:hypothetical protein RvY_10464 [Ramazzottius varieornatus]|uniref:Protein kinase domain-containing protein n=1 Tax=Ramazzottius varieornatus TaxID=947166 RepID=A0A1D1VCU8_RAMVA|nr:hypothetical protein RvY_10464 [Ramazzottius varieornatus]